ncbi:hypothetical protein CR513_26720, partial [Mucuna pruriens]
MTHQGFYIQEGFLFKGKKLCVPKSLVRELLVNEAHEGGLMGHFGKYKTYKTLLEHFFWPHGLPQSKSRKDSIFVVVYKEVIRLHDLLRIIVSNRDSKFLNHFCRTLWNKLGTKLLFSTTCHP